MPVNIPTTVDLKDFALIIGFIGTCAVLLWRVGAAERMLLDHENRIRELEKER